jgi:dipeptidyl aminopeptidase/acylaminoacyl peptidase
MNARRTTGVLALALMLAAALAGPVNAAFPGDNGRVVSVEPRYDGDTRVAGMIYSARPSGEGRNNLARGSSPTYSPDGSKIAYRSGRSIWVMNASGANKTRVTNPPADWWDARPAWAPGGRRLLFQRSDGEDTVVFIKRLSRGKAEGLKRGVNAEWSVDNTIAYIDYESGTLYTITPGDAQGKPHKIGNRATDLTWSPNGNQLAVIKPEPETDRECLVILYLKAGNQQTLTCQLDGEGGGDVNGLAWAPQGGSIVVGIEDKADGKVSGRSVRVFLNGDPNKGFKGAQLQPDWQPVS